MPNPTISILIVDDHPVVRIGLRTLLKGELGLNVVGEAQSTADALTEMQRLRPNVVLLDLRLSDGTGLDLCRRIKELSAPTKVLFLSSYGDNASVIAAITAGADGYLLKDVDGIDIPGAIRKIAAGGTVLDPVAARHLVTTVRAPNQTVEPKGTERAKMDSLSSQERRVLALVAEGKSNRETAELLKLSEGTVKNYLANVFTKIDARNRTEAVSLWQRWIMSHEREKQ